MTNLRTGPVGSSGGILFESWRRVLAPFFLTKFRSSEPPPVRKLVIYAILIALLFFPLSLRAQSDSLRFWTALPEPDHQVMLLLVDRYNEQHATQPVTYQNFASPRELYEALQQNDSPELALIDSAWIEHFKSKLIPADDILNKAGEMVRAVAHTDTFKPIWDVCVLQNTAYAIPFSAETAALAVNMRYFKTTPKISNLKELEKVATALKKNPVNVAPLVLPVGWGNAEFGKLWTGFVVSSTNLPKSNEQNPNPSPINLHDEATALNVWWNWINRSGLASVEDFSFPEGYIHGATWILHPREVAILPEKSVIEALPKLKRPWGYLNVQALAFFNTDRGWTFANYLTDYVQLKYWSMHTQTVPVNKQVYLSPDYLQEIDANRPWMRLFIAVVNPFPKNLSWSSERFDKVGEALLKTLRKELPVEEGVLKIHDALFGKIETVNQ